MCHKGAKSFWNDGGFSETELQPNIFNVKLVGNQFTSEERAQDFALLRAAELCTSRDMNFMNIDAIETQLVKSGYIPGSPATANTKSNADVIGNRVYGSSTTTYNPATPGKTLYSPKSVVTVQCTLENFEASWDALFLMNSLKTKYGIEQ